MTPPIHIDRSRAHQARPTRKVLDSARELAEEIASCAMQSNRLAKTLVSAGFDGPLDAGLMRAIRAEELVFAGTELHLGAAAFLALTDPEITDAFQGGR